MQVEREIDVFLKWLKTKGFQNDRLKIQPSKNGGHGIFSGKNYRTNDVILQIPEYLMITSDTVWHSDLKNALTLHSGLLHPFDALCLFLMCEKLKGLQSDWFPYICSLPSSSNLPINLPNLDLSCCPPQIKELILAQREEILHIKERVKTVFNEWAKTVSLNGQIIAFDETLFVWAWGTVTTRSVFKPNTANDVFNNVEDDNIALIPFLDMLNCLSDPKTEAQFSENTKCYQLVLTNGEIAEGEEIFIPYGPFGNNKLFVEYGFVFNDNCNNSVQFSLEDLRSILDDYEPHNTNQIISENHWATVSTSHLNCSVYLNMEEPSWDFMAVFCVLNLPENKLTSWKNVLCSISDLCDDPESVKMARYFLSTYLTRLKKQRPIENNLKNIPTYWKNCVLQLWNDDIFMIEKSLSQL